MPDDKSAKTAPTGVGDPATAPRQPSRFSYATGARPLSGYTIKRGVGVGGFGEVYYATSDAGKDVALKRIQRNLDVELRGVRQCLNLKHTNLLALFDIRYDEEGQAWVVMEYVPGENLQDRIDRFPQGMAVDDVHHWFDGMAAGVAHLHDCGIVHRDLKPGNIFLDQDTVKIGDYGLSKFISCSRRSGQTQSVGTFHYMAPEIGQGRYGKEIDIYALGIMLYEMLTGHVPYEGESSQEIIMKHLTAHPDLTALPQPYRDVVGRALAKAPERRFVSVDEMRQAVTACRADVPVMSASQPIRAADGPRGWPDEPIARSVQQGWVAVDRQLQSSPGGSVLRVALLIVGLLLLAGNIRWLIPYALVVGCFYFLYLGIRALILPSPQDRGTNTASPTAPRSDEILMAQYVAPTRAPGKRVPRRLPSKAAIDAHLRHSFRRRSRAEHGADLTGGFLLAFMVSVVLGIALLLIPGVAGDDGMRGAIYEWLPVYAWTTLTSVVAAWTILLLGKLWEGSTGDVARRRFALLVAGMFVGIVSWAVAQFLMVRPTYLLDIPRTTLSALPTALHDVDGLPRLPGYMAYFGALFLLLRWWKQADPLRRVRLSLWGTGITALWAIVLYSICPFPRGFLIAVTTAIAIQMSAPWITPVERKRLLTQARARAANAAH